jgi:hypothetical protein
MSFGARQYDPQIGRFLSIDPLAAFAGQDKYSPYAAMGNQPESTIDPNGLQGIPLTLEKAQAYGGQSAGGWATDLGFTLNDNTRGGGDVGGATYIGPGGGANGTSIKITNVAAIAQILNMLGGGASVDQIMNSNEGFTQDGKGSGLTKDDPIVLNEPSVSGKKPGFFGKLWGSIKNGVKSFFKSGDNLMNDVFKENWVGDLANGKGGSESSWEGKEGFKNKGLPTMVKTVSVLGVGISGGSLALEATGYVNASLMGTATTTQAVSATWSAASLTVGTINTVNTFTGNTSSAADMLNYKVGGTADLVDGVLYKNPIGMINLGIRVVDLSVNNTGNKYFNNKP